MVGGDFHALPNEDEWSRRYIVTIKEPDAYAGLGFIDFATTAVDRSRCCDLVATFALPGLANILVARPA
jgi:hypothetical protein